MTLNSALSAHQTPWAGDGHSTGELLHESRGPTSRQVSRATFDAATAKFGQRGVMTLTSLIAYYAVLAYNMNVYELEAPAHQTERALTP